ncbi:TRAP transporter solute receptor, TAXI family precursor, partial [hydrothermal vent metagenome]
LLVAAAAAFVGVMAMAPGSEAQETKYVNIGTGGIGGDFYPSGGYICNLLNKGRKKYGYKIRCTVESTAGSVANLRAIQAGELSVGIAEADSQAASWAGTGSFKATGANKNLRYLFALGADVMHVVTRKDTGIKSFLDLKGRIVNTGNVGSGGEALIEDALSKYGTTTEKFFKQATKLTSREQAQALCDGKIDAFIYPVAISAATIAEATNTCDAVVVSWNDATISKMVDGVGYFSPMVIPAGTYRGQDSDATTWASPATILADANADDEVIYNLVKAVFDNFENLKKQSSIYTGATREGAVTAGRTVPYHPAALRYYKEVGLIK